MTWLSIPRQTSMKKTSKTQRHTQSTDLAVNTQADQNEDQEERYTTNLAVNTQTHQNEEDLDHEPAYTPPTPRPPTPGDFTTW